MTEPAHEYLVMKDQDGNDVEFRVYTTQDPFYGKGYSWWMGEPGGVGYPPVHTNPTDPTGPTNPPIRALVTLDEWEVLFPTKSEMPKIRVQVQSTGPDSISIGGYITSSTGWILAHFNSYAIQVNEGVNTFIIDASAYMMEQITETMIATLNIYGPKPSPEDYGEIYSGTKYVPAPAGRAFKQNSMGRVTSTNKVAEFSSPEPLEVGDVVNLNAKWITLSSATIKLTPTGSNSGPSKSVTSNSTKTADETITYTVTQAGYLTGRITHGSGQALDYTMTMSLNS